MKDEVLNETVCVAVTKKEKQMIQKLSEKEERSISWILRLWICEKLGIIKKK